MPRCSHCGKVNREGSLFCQDCGHRLEAAPAAAKPAPAAGPVCAACGTVNPPGMNFCKMCGTSLAQKQPAAAAVASTMVADAGMAAGAPAAQGGKVSCPACGKQTPAGFAFCQHCGQRLSPQPQPQPSPARPASGAPPVATASTLSAPSSPMVNPTPPAGMMRPQMAPGAERPVTSSRTASDDAMAKTMAPSAEMVAQMRAQVSAARPSAQPAKIDTLVDEKPPAEVAAEKKFGTLVAVNRDGSDGQAMELTGEAFDIGRSEGRLNFESDPYLAPRHARLLPQNGKVILRAIDHVNGVYVRVHGSCDLQPGDSFLVGKEVIKYETCSPEEREPPSLVEHGVRLFGSSPRESWGRLRQITISGTTRDVWHLTRPELVLGREEGDVTFPDDEFMSRRHAAVKKAGGKVKLEDLNSSNGTFVRVKGDRELSAGDVVRLGDQLMRFEP